MLLAQSAEPRQIVEEQPWLDARFILQAEVAAALSAGEGRRGIKTHSPLTALPLHDDVLYINVAHDPRDASAAGCAIPNMRRSTISRSPNSSRSN